MRIISTAARLSNSAWEINQLITAADMSEEQEENWEQLWKLVLSAEKDLEHLKQSLDPVAPVSWRQVDARSRQQSDK